MPQERSTCLSAVLTTCHEMMLPGSFQLPIRYRSKCFCIDSGDLVSRSRFDTGETLMLATVDCQQVL
jgi:hypothetical protein